MSATQSIFGIEETKGVLVITPHGDALSYREIDIDREVNAIRSRIDALPEPRIVVDLSGVPYIGSIMIGAISDFAEHARQHGGVFAVCGVSSELHSVLSVMKLDTRWPMFDTRRAALKFARKAEA